jgi:hypothetical protein
VVRGLLRALLTTLPCHLASGRSQPWGTISRKMGIPGTFPSSRQIKPRRVSLFREPGPREILNPRRESTMSSPSAGKHAGSGRTQPSKLTQHFLRGIEKPR